MPPRFRICPLCQQGFGSASINIHIPQCYEKAVKRWRLNPVGPMPVMPSLGPSPRQNGGKQIMTCSARGNGVSGARSLRQQTGFADVPEFAEENMNLHPCSHCGRKFLFDRITYHESVCKGDVKRRVFNSRKQRAVEDGGDSNDGGFGMSYGKKKKGLKSSAGGTGLSAGIPRTRWREQHREFQEAMRAARNAQSASRDMWGGASLRDPPAQQENRQRAPPAVMRHQKGLQIRQQRTMHPIDTGFSRQPAVGRRVPPRRPYGNAFGGGGERFTSGIGGGGGGKIINDNTTSLGMLQAFGRA
ncbi:hypothetical protein DQ04_00571060 [Trypanosoma grayi]|uniref:hypothetical protein n=1 Tax=Trypanosoma grayi TaxID=71804 RepID=UPI0004F43A21|nr:hypothetical protein DQ04_00571060 [Trypanosoma grayi]KEG14211.1 hypothetical protein DQ04_00571060 [Trypanosoma grayi]